MTEILLSWVGATDLRAPEAPDKSEHGPVAQAIKLRKFDEVALISDYPQKQTNSYIKWLKELSPVKLDLRHTFLSSSTHFGEIYKITSSIVSEKVKEYGPSVNLFFQLRRSVCLMRLPISKRSLDGLNLK